MTDISFAEPQKLSLPKASDLSFSFMAPGPVNHASSLPDISF